MNKYELMAGMTIHLPDSPLVHRYVTAVGCRWYLWVDAEERLPGEVIGDLEDLEMWELIDGHYVAFGKRGNS